MPQAMICITPQPGVACLLVSCIFLYLTRKNSVPLGELIEAGSYIHGITAPSALFL
jgi:hypothetical protein